MENNNDWNEELKNLSSTLHSIKKNDMLKPPAGYFDALPSQIQDKINKKKEIKSAWSRLLRPSLLVPSFAVASCFAIMIYFNVKRQINPEPLSADDINQSDYVYNIDQSLIVEALDAKVFENENTSAEEIDYLLESNIDVSEIESQLE